MIEPYELKGRVIDEAFYDKVSKARTDLVIRFTDGVDIRVQVETWEDEITGADVATLDVIIQRCL
jgi:hypothetical protein